MAYETIRLETGVTPGVVHVVLCRSDVRNAFNELLIEELTDAFRNAVPGDDVRLVVLRGEGSMFCAGADLNWMRTGAQASLEAAEQGAREMAGMYMAVARCPAPVLAKVHGAALGGGAGLVAACDIAIVEDDTRIGFTEVRLGIIPAVISPFVLRKIGETHARRYFLTGEVFDGAEAARIGLAQRTCPSGTLDEVVDEIVDELGKAGPQAVTEAKLLVDAVVGVGLEAAVDITAPWIAKLRASEEGQEGMAAFLEKRRPNWMHGDKK